MPRIDKSEEIKKYKYKKNQLKCNKNKFPKKKFTNFCYFAYFINFFYMQLIKKRFRTISFFE